MHQYHVGICESEEDPLPGFLRLYRINAKAIERRVLAVTAEKVEAIQRSLNRRNAKKPAGKAAARLLDSSPGSSRVRRVLSAASWGCS